MESNSTSDSSRPGLEDARIQFIQAEFAPFLAGFEAAQSSLQIDRFYWIHDRLFVDGWSPERIRCALNGAETRGRIIAVTSGKGGVGKTTVSLNLAVALAQAGRRTLLLDGDFGMGNVHVYAGITPSVTIADVLDGRRSLEDSLTDGPSGLKILCGASGIARIASVDRRRMHELGSQISRVAAQFDVVVLDTGAGIGSQVMSLLGLADDIIVLATPNLASILDAYGVIKAAHEREVTGRLNLLANLARNEEEANAVRDRIASCARQFLNLSLNDAGWLPRAPRAENANQSRRAVVESSPNSEITRRIRAIAQELFSESGCDASTASSPRSAAA